MIRYAASRIPCGVNVPDALLGRTLVLVAHPDDETVGCGALLQQAREPIVVFATDGAPRDRQFWGPHGSRSHYAELRRQESRAALALAGVSKVIFLAEAAGNPGRFLDQELYRVIPGAVAALGDLVVRYNPQTLLTLAYEGGHPDHDTCSFLAAIVARRHNLPVWEFPLYHRQHAHALCGIELERAGELIYQRFMWPRNHEITLEVTPGQLEIKRTMLAAYSSQHPFLFEFDPALERFRPQPAYDYSQLPHPGPLNYEAWQWSVRGDEVCAAFRKFLNE